uniref:Putative secreted protein n=1 Tax=Ixodes ricinus TaxID=34613 RepID=A0A0K8R5L2_IXORI
MRLMKSSDLAATTKCLKRYMDEINSHMDDLGNMETSKMDAYIENMEKSTHFPEKPKCFKWTHDCADDATKEFLDRAASTYEIFQKVIVDKHALKSLAVAYKCYDSNEFTHCLTGIIDDFYTCSLECVHST